MLAFAVDIRERRPRHPGSYQGRIDVMAKISVSLPDDLVVDLQAAARDNVSAFVAAAVRNELDRRRLQVLVKELEAEVGPVNEAQVAKFSAMLANVDAENARLAARDAKKARTSERDRLGHEGS